MLGLQRADYIRSISLFNLSLLGAIVLSILSCGRFQALKGNVFSDKALFSKQMCDNPGTTPTPTPPPEYVETKTESTDPNTCKTIEIRYDCSDRITESVGTNLVRQEGNGVSITVYEEGHNDRLTLATHLDGEVFRKNIWSQVVNTKEMTFNLRNIAQMLGKPGDYAIQFRANEVPGSSLAPDLSDITDAEKGNIGSLKNAIRLSVDDNMTAHLRTGTTELIYSGNREIDPEEKENCDRRHSPLMANLDGGPITLSPPTAGTKFDINGDGKVDRISWPTQDSVVFLVHDRNNNGVIEDVHEMFGDNTKFTGGKTYSNGFEALRTFDANGDNRIDRADSRFGELQFWSPSANKLHRLGDVGVESIDLNYANIDEKDEFKNSSRQRSLMDMSNGSRIKIFDVYFRTIPSK
ncbi:MAG: hypothetical protein H6624_02765 [Bdellovibrionaceae bacterium]|nr:hypothetical protein [Bdellovibrionales bacterium]MCB9083234.1 hypothetical protein [Pseudobdellovibrionaceae bacterium]